MLVKMEIYYIRSFYNDTLMKYENTKNCVAYLTLLFLSFISINTQQIAAIITLYTAFYSCDVRNWGTWSTFSFH